MAGGDQEAADQEAAAPTLAQRRAGLAALVLERGHERRAEPFRLSSGGWSQDYLDLRRALAEGAALRSAAETVIALAQELAVAFDVVGGMTMGADPLAHGIAVVSGARWFSVRKEPKVHGTGRRVEGGPLGPGDAALLVEDTVTTGSALLGALDVVEATGAQVVLAVALVDRGGQVAPHLAARGVRYRPVLTSGDLGLEPVAAGPAGPPGPAGAGSGP